MLPAKVAKDPFAVVARNCRREAVFFEDMMVVLVCRFALVKRLVFVRQWNCYASTKRPNALNLEYLFFMRLRVPSD